MLSSLKYKKNNKHRFKWRMSKLVHSLYDLNGSVFISSSFVDEYRLIFGWIQFVRFQPSIQQNSGNDR